MKCKICGNNGEKSSFIVREMMLGLRDEFEYMLCNKCGCLQLVDVPTKMHKYYPDNYYSFSNKTIRHSIIKRFLTKQRDIFNIEGENNLIGKIINHFKPASSFIKIISETGINRNSRILDVGTGYGNILMPLINAGFSILGIDPYLSKDEVHKNNLKILKKNIYQIDGEWDLIMLNHVFEHLPDPSNVLFKINKLLSPNGKCLIRIPIVPSYVWEKYKTNWIQIDAPRHFFLHSIKSLELLAIQNNLQTEKIIYDSTPFQFLGSELYAKNIPMKDGDFRLNENNTMFSFNEIKSFVQETLRLNESKNGDQAAFIFSKTNFNTI